MEENIGDVLLKLGLALLIGTVVGAEREYENKSAGLRTLILICPGSTFPQNPEQEHGNKIFEY